MKSKLYKETMQEKEELMVQEKVRIGMVNGPEIQIKSENGHSENWQVNFIMEGAWMNNFRDSVLMDDRKVWSWELAAKVKISLRMRM